MEIIPSHSAVAECCVLPVTEDLFFLMFISARRQSGELIRDMTVVNFRTLVCSCVPVSSEPCRPSTSFGAAGVSSHPLHDVSVGRGVASSSLRVSPGVVSTHAKCI